MALRTTYSDNWDEVSGDLAAMAKPRTVTLRIVNDAQDHETGEYYAVELHERIGYSVVNDAVAAETMRAHLRGVLAEGFTVERISEAIENAALEMLRYYTDVVGVKSSDGRHLPGPRPLHRGNWGTDYGTLVRSFYYRIGTGSAVRFTPEEG